MKISASTIRQLLEMDPTFIAPMSRDRKSQPLEGSKVDLTLKSVFTLDRSAESLSAFMGVKLRTTPATVTIKPQDLPVSPSLPRVGQGWTLTTGYYLLQTVEQLNMPHWLIGVIRERSTIFRNGSIVRVTDADPGFCGHITAGLYVPPGSQLTLEENVRFLSIKFEPITNIVFRDNLPDSMRISLDPADNDPYEGVWTGDKTSTQGLVERGY